MFFLWKILKNCNPRTKGGLISEKISLWLKSPKKAAKNYPEYYYPPKEKLLRIVI